MDAAIQPDTLKSLRAGARPPLVIDVRKTAAFTDASDMMAGALRRDPLTVDAWTIELPAASSVVVYCVHGHEVSQNVASRLRAAGLTAAYLEGGLEEGWKSAGGELIAKAKNSPMRWVTRERPKIDRIACPWLIKRFIDPSAEFLYVPTPNVRDVAEEKTAVAYDVPDVAFTHDGDLCSFDAFLKTYRLTDPALARLALIVRGADTNHLELAPQSAGLFAISLGLSRNFPDDHEMLAHGMVVYDALYAWCRHGQDETHTWNPAAYR